MAPRDKEGEEVAIVDMAQSTTNSTNLRPKGSEGKGDDPDEYG